MKPRWLIVVILIGFTVIFLVDTSLGEEGGKPRTFLKKLEHLELAKKLWRNGNPVFGTNIREVIIRADGALKRGPYSLTQRKHKHHNGGGQDFFAFGAYYWPNPNTRDGLPWVARDGRYNPESSMDWDLLGHMSNDVEELALAYYFTENEAYADHAALLLSTWFIDKDTRMNPNMNYGKVIPGIREGGFPVAGFGMVITRVYDSAGILERSSSWSDEDKKAMQEWTKCFLRWMQSSPYGKKELATRNNHTTFYHVIWMLMSMYVGDFDGAKTALSSYITRLPEQFLPDGTQPFEMMRNNNYRYHLINLEAAFDIAQMADHLGNIDVWNFKTGQDASLRKSVYFLMPYLTDQKKWGYFKNETFMIPSRQRWVLLRRAAVGFNDWTFEKAAKAIVSGSDPFIELSYPEVAVSGKPGRD